MLVKMGLVWNTAPIHKHKSWRNYTNKNILSEPPPPPPQKKKVTTQNAINSVRWLKGK